VPSGSTIELPRPTTEIRFDPARRSQFGRGCALPCRARTSEIVREPRRSAAGAVR
jgi:hypothetical protein